MSLPHRFVSLDERRRLHNARVVNQNIRASTKLLINPFERALDAFCIGDIAFHGKRFNAELFSDLLRDPFNLVARARGYCD